MYSKTIIVGKLGTDAEVRQTSGDKTVAKLSVATDNSYKVGDEWKKQTDWHKVVVWGWQAQKTKSWQKGQTVFVEGRMQTRSWENKEGQKVYTTELVANTVKNFDHVSGQSQNDGLPNFDSDDEIPF